LMSLLSQDTNGVTTMYALEEASLLGPWSLEEAQELAVAAGSANADVQIQVACHFATTVSPAILRVLLQRQLPERVSLYLARSSRSTLDSTVKELALRTLYELSSSSDEKIRELAILWLPLEGLDYVDVFDQIRKLAIADSSDRIRYNAAVALTHTDEREFAIEQLLQLQHSQDPVVLMWLAAALGTLPSYQALARTIWLRLTAMREQFDCQVEVLTALAQSYFDEDTKALIVQALRTTPKLASELRGLELSRAILLRGNEDQDLKLVLLEALLSSPHYEFIRELYFSLLQSQHLQEIEFCNAHFRSLLTQTTSDHKKLLAARWLYDAEKNRAAHDELLALARTCSDMAIRQVAAEAVNDLDSTLELARSAERPGHRRAALLNLCGMAKDHPSVLPAIRDVARSDRSPSMRIQAARWLQRPAASPDDHELGLLVFDELAHQSSDEEVQLEAAQQLVLYPVLAHLAETAQAVQIRQRASDTLAWLDIRADILQLNRLPTIAGVA
jgi:hypothetical protein